MRFLSVCSGIEAASVAWHPLGWKAWAFSEIDAFANAVLAHRYTAAALDGRQPVVRVRGGGACTCHARNFHACPRFRPAACAGVCSRGFACALARAVAAQALAQCILVDVGFGAFEAAVDQYGEKTGPPDTDGHTHAIAFAWQAGGNETSSGAFAGGLSPTLLRNQTMAVQHAMQVRRLTPTECERLMGFPDVYTAIPWRGKPAADGPRYKALGYSWATNCARWIGWRIALVDSISREPA
jgi:site-specific DNA-cytosine methylase